MNWGYRESVISTIPGKQRKGSHKASVDLGANDGVALATVRDDAPHAKVDGSGHEGWTHGQTDELHVERFTLELIVAGPVTSSVAHDLE